jgi:hypothetical protein
MNTELIAALSVLHKYLPEAWLIPCDNKKRPAGNHLGANERHITPDALRKALKSESLELPCWYDYTTKDKKIVKDVSEHVSGYKLLTGKVFTYRCQQVVLVAVDLDGESADDELKKILNGEDLPRTVSWSSGKPGRRTHLFYLPEQKSKNIQSKFSVGKLEIIAGWPGVVVPPSAHPETGKYVFLDGCSFEDVAIGELPSSIFSKLATVPRFKSLDEIPIPTESSVPLIECCSREVRGLVSTGVPEGSGHNDAALRVALELVGVERYLQQIGQPYDSNADDLFRDFLVASSVNENRRSLERLEWAHKKNYIEPSCKPEGVNNCIRGWYWTNVLRQPGAILKQGNLNLITPQMREDIWSELTNIHSGNMQAKDVEIKLTSICERYNLDIKQVDRLYRKVENEINAKTEDELAKEDFFQYIKIKSTKLDISKILPPSLADDLKLNAKSKYHPVRCLAYIWPAVATLTGAKVKVWANKPSGWSSDLVFYCVDIGRKGSGKTPAGKDTLHYIFERDRQSRADWEREESHLAQMRARWDAMTSHEKSAAAENAELNPALYEQQMTPERKYKFDSPTVPAVVKYLGLQPKWHSGILYNDELASLFAGFNQFTKGGNDRQFWLEFFNGRSWKVLERVTDTPGTCRRLNGQLMQVVGGMQLDAFKKYLALSTSQDGLTDRFLISDPPEIAPPTELPKSGTGSSAILEKIYRLIERIELRLDDNGDPLPTMIDWEPDAAGYWEQCYLGLNDLSYRLRKENCDFAGYCSKLITYFPRLAGALSLIWQASELGEEDFLIPSNIPLHIAEKTWDLIKYYACQYLAIQHSGDEAREPILSEIWDIVEAEGSITPRTVVHRFGRRKINDKKMDTKTAIKLLHQLEESGFGAIEMSRTSIKLIFKAPAEELFKENLFKLKPASKTPGIADIVRLNGASNIPDGLLGVIGIVNGDGTYVVATELGDLVVNSTQFSIQS